MYSKYICNYRYAVSSFSFDPFDTSYLMTGAEDGEIRVGIEFLYYLVMESSKRRNIE